MVVVVAAAGRTITRRRIMMSFLDVDDWRLSMAWGRRSIVLGMANPRMNPQIDWHCLALALPKDGSIKIKIEVKAVHGI